MHTNLVPLAGEGSRYKKAGYSTPKPLIEVQGVPMIVAAASTLPEAGSNVFLCRKEHINSYGIDKILKRHFSNTTIVTVEKLTEGQASTCLLAKSYIDPESELTIGACDNGMEWDYMKFKKLMNSTGTDVIIWTFRNYPPVKLRPEMYGWVEVDKKGFAESVSVKIPISDKPMNDHAVIGTFSFKKAQCFFDYTEQMIKQNRRINNEFYIDELMNVMIEADLNVKVFEVDTYLGWGTPNELKTFNYWSDYFNHVSKN